MIPNSRKSIIPFSQFSPIFFFHSDKSNIEMKIAMEQWPNYIDRERQKYSDDSSIETSMEQWWNGNDSGKPKYWE